MIPSSATPVNSVSPAIKKATAVVTAPVATLGPTLATVCNSACRVSASPRRNCRYCAT